MADLQAGAAWGVEGHRKGRFWCATYDATFSSGEAVSVVGGENTALTDVLCLTRPASSVEVTYCCNQFTAGRVLLEGAMSEPEAMSTWDTEMIEIEGNEAVKRPRLKRSNDDTISRLEPAGVFVAIGLEANNRYPRGVLLLGAGAGVITNESVEAKMPLGLAAVGICPNSAGQVLPVTAPLLLCWRRDF